MKFEIVPGFECTAHVNAAGHVVVQLEGSPEGDEDCERVHVLINDGYASRWIGPGDPGYGGEPVAERWTREGRCLSYDGESAIAIERVIQQRTAKAKLDPVTCDAIADFVCTMLNTIDVDALVKKWMAK